jgi:hypothetical protein
MKRGIQPIIPRVEKLLAYTQINNLLVLKKVAQPWIASYMLELWNWVLLFKNDFSFSKRKAARSSTSDQPSKSDNAVTIDLMMMGG